MARFPSTAAPGEDSFDQPIQEIERRLEELAAYPASRDTQQEMDRLKSRLDALRREIYAQLSPWQKTLVARHAQRPYTLDYIRCLIDDFVEIHGDRKFKDDPAIVGGFGLLRATPVCLLGHQKGRDTKEKLLRNFGMPRPEGYRKAERIMHLAEKFGRPILSFIDTPGAYPGIGAEERGQAEAIARCLKEMASLTVPFVATVTGEGGSGGALALGMADVVNMLEHSIYSVISPEGCAAILWKDQEKWKKEAARALRMTAPDLLSLGVIDEILPEPPGGAHTDPQAAARMVGEAIERQLAELARLDPMARRERRHQKFRRMGSFLELMS
ncbi:MAG TPA: acetyl-CoA carboxylase carboxyltransferase subunit alpha [Candidatus Polarisedimenticolia bacterium]|nr:acetyl-CoA carboxylase carboxyltransferase subunit alpha [Candidatus Polarisedimenticolia bacterium]